MDKLSSISFVIINTPPSPSTNTVEKKQEKPYSGFISRLRGRRRNNKVAIASDVVVPEAVVDTAIDFAVDALVAAAVGSLAGFGMPMGVSIKTPTNPYAKQAQRISAVNVSLLGEIHTGMTGQDLYDVCYAEGRRGYLRHKGHTIANNNTLLVDYGLNDYDVVEFVPVGLCGGGVSRQRPILATKLLLLCGLVVNALLWLAMQLMPKSESSFDRIVACERKLHRNIMKWVTKVCAQTCTRSSMRRTVARKSRFCPQNVAVTMLEQELLLGAHAGLSNAEWDKAYVKAVEDWAFMKLEAQSFSLEGVETVLENALALCEKRKVDDFVKLSEDVLVMLLMLSKARTRMDTVGAFAVFAKLRVSGSLTLGAFRSALLLALDWFFAPTAEQALELGDIRKVLDSYSDFKHSALAERLHCFMLFAIGYSIFDKVGMKVDVLKLKTVAEAAKDRGAWKSTDFAYLVLETTQFICERGVQCYKLGSLQPMFHSTRTHDAWINQCDKLKLWSSCLGNPEPHGFTVFQYQNELEDAIEKGESVVKVVGMEGPREKQAATKVLNELKMLKAGLISTNDASADRLEPFGVLVAGGSSVMKSTFTKMLYYHYAKVMGLPGTSDYRYVRNHQDEYWSGFKTSKWCVHLDDIAPFKPSAVMGVDPSVSEALQIMNTVAFVTNQAELADKGRVPLRARLVTASTNVIDINAFAYYENDLAPRRRFPMVISLRMKPEYMENGMVDTSSIPKLEHGYHDVWEITVHKVVCATSGQGIVGKQRAKLEEVATYTKVDDFLEDFSLMAIRHYETQQKASTADNHMAALEICKKCYRSKCRCFSPQARSSWFSSSDVVDEGYRPLLAHEEEETKSNESDHEHASDSDDEDESNIYHSCSFDKEVELVSKIENGWKVRLVNPSAMQLCSGSFEFDALQRDLMRGPNLTLMWCGERAQKEREVAAFDPSKCVMESTVVKTVADDYFDVVRKKRTMRQLMWWCSYPIQWTVHFMVNYRLGRWFATRLFVWTLPRKTLFWFMSKTMGDRAQMMLRVMSLTMSNLHKRKPYLVHIGAICAISLAVHMTLSKVMARKKEDEAAPEPAVYTLEQRVEMAKQTLAADDVILDETPIEDIKKLMDEQVSVRPPVAHEKEYENVWADHDVKQVRFSVSDMSASWAGMSWDNIHAKVKWNTAIFIMKKRGPVVTHCTETRALCIASRIYLVNAHAWIDDCEITMLFESNGNNVTANMTFPSKSVRIHKVPGTDFVAVEVVHAPVRKNLIPLVPHEIFRGRAEGMYVVRHPDSVERVCVANVRFDGNITTGRIIDQPAYLSRAARDTQPGECGSPLFARVNGAVMLLGIHGAGYGPYAGALAFTQQQLHEIVNHFEFSKVSTGEPQLKVGNIVQHVGPTHHKSHTLFEQGVALVVGGDPTFRPKGASKVGPTRIAGALNKRGVVTDKQAPNLKSWKPFSLALKDLLATNRTVDVNILHACAEDYVNEIMPHMPENWKDDVHFYPVDTAVNGADGVAYVDALNKNTSAGAPVHCSKRRYMSFDVSTGKWTLDPAMVEAVERINEAYANKQKANPIFMAHLKDQAIPEKKAKADKVRVFVGGPMAWTIAVRQRLLWFIRLAQCNRLLFELGAGTVAQSTEWGNICKYLTHFGEDRIVAGDFGKFDKRMGSCFILYAYWIIAQFAEQAGMPRDEIDEIWCIAEDTAFAFTNFNGDLIMFLGSNPSGHPLTVIVNSLVNSLYMRYVFRQVAPPEERSRFKHHVRLYTYGDDNIMGVRKGSDWFNHTVISAKLAEIGVEYTMADKESESVPFIHIRDASFLKRKWRYDEDVGAMLAPLEEESIRGSLLVGIVSKDMTPEAHSIAVMQGALVEFFFHGREVFERWRTMFEQVIVEEGLQDWLEGDLRTWEQCLYSFKRASRSYEAVKKVYTDGWLDTLD